MAQVTAPYDSAEDLEWIRQTLAGDRNAFAHLITKYKDKLYDLASRVLANPTEAEDVLQEAFVEAYRHLADFHQKSKFSTWIYSIVLNRVRNRLRHRKVLRWFSLDTPLSEDHGDRMPQVPEDGPSLETLTENRLEMQNLQRAVRTLPLQYQSIFILHYFHNMPLEEVSQKLDRPLGTVKVYLHRARKLLYKRFQQQPALATESEPTLATDMMFGSFDIAASSGRTE